MSEELLKADAHGGRADLGDREVVGGGARIQEVVNLLERVWLENVHDADRRPADGCGVVADRRVKASEGVWRQQHIVR